MTPAAALDHAIRNPKRGTVARMPYLVAGFPDKAAFGTLLRAVAEEADAIELGVPFTDPMADGVTIQEASEKALAQGVSLRWILSMLGDIDALGCPVVLMSYLNPLLAYGLPDLVRDARSVGVTGFIVPDLPLEEGAELEALCAEAGLARIQLVTPVTSDDRMQRLCRASAGFIYAVTVTGITGGNTSMGGLSAYLDRIREAATVPVCAGFGISEAADLEALRGHADGAIVGSALIRVLADGGDAVQFLRNLET